MKSEYWNNETQRKLEIFARDNDQYPAVTVYQFASLRDFNLQGATINWSAIGSTSADTADLYAEAIRIAAQWARDWNKDVGKNPSDVFSTQAAPAGA